MSKGEDELMELPKAILRNRIDPLDVLILNKLSAGASKTTLADEINKEYGMSLKRTEIEKRVERLTQNGVLLRLQTIVVDPTKLFDHVFLIWLKLPLRPLLRRDELTWKRASQRILEINKKFGNTIMLLFTPEGEGEYDIVALVCTNDLTKHYLFLEQLTKEELIEKSKTQRVHYPALFYFDPVLLPSYEECKYAYAQFKETLEQMKV